MAFFQSTGPAGMRMASFDFSFVASMTLLQHSSTTLSWFDAAGSTVTIGGRGIGSVVSGDTLVDVTKGIFDNFSMHYRAKSLIISDWEVSGAAFWDLVAAEQWKKLALLMVSGDDIILGTPVMDVILGGAGHDLLNGLGGNDKMSGGAKMDILYGGMGNDTMSGGEGGDFFYFDVAPTEAGIDLITDFEHRKDMFAISRAVFPNVGPQGIMNNHWFYTGDPAREGRQGIIYDRETGQVFSDADGIGSAPRVQFAQVDPGMLLTASDFFVF